MQKNKLIDLYKDQIEKYEASIENHKNKNHSINKRIIEKRKKSNKIKGKEELYKQN